MSRGTRSEVANLVNCGIGVSEFELHSCDNFHVRTNTLEKMVWILIPL